MVMQNPRLHFIGDNYGYTDTTYAQAIEQRNNDRTWKHGGTFWMECVFWDIFRSPVAGSSGPRR